MMKCKRHPHEEGAGVCASCLRDRLLALQTAQNGVSPDNHRRNHPPPILVPRSVSPYVAHRRSADSDAASDASDTNCHRRSYHTPQVGDRLSDREKTHGCRRFPLLSSLFHRHHRGSDESEASASVSWFSSLIHRRRKKKKTKRTVPSPPMRKTKSFVVSDRGMSPVRCEETYDNASESGYSTESSATWRRPTSTRRAAAERHPRNGRGFAGFTVCLSPLVRPGPTSRRCQPPDSGFSGELRSNGVPVHNRHVSAAGGSFGPNRSRKLADRGRFR